MQIREHVGADKPAIILHPSGTVVTFDELEARANRLAHHFRAQRAARGRRRRDPDGEQRAHARRHVGGAPQRPVLRADQHPPHRRPRRPTSSTTAPRRRSSARRRSARPARTSASTCPTVCPPCCSSPTTRPRRLARSYPEGVAGQPDTPIADEIEGDLLQYSSGTTGRPKGIKRELPHVPPSEAPGLMAALVAFWMDPDAVYLSPAPLYHTAPSVWSMQIQAGGITTVVLEKFDAEGCLDAIAAPPRHPRAVRARDVHPDAETAGGRAQRAMTSPASSG